METTTKIDILEGICYCYGDLTLNKKIEVDASFDEFLKTFSESLS